MQDIIAKLLNSQEGIITLVVTIVIGLNILLTSALKFLGWLKDRTASQADDKAHAVLSKVLGYTEKVLAFASANSAALPSKARAEVDKGEWKQPVASPAEAEKLADAIVEELKSEEPKA